MSLKRNKVIRVWLVFCLFIGALIVGNVNAAPNLSVGTVNAEKGTTANVPIVFDNNGRIVSFQFDITYDSLQLTSLDAVDGSALAVGNQVESFLVGSGVRRIVVTPTNDNAFLYSGESVIIPFEISLSASYESQPIMITNVVLTNADSIKESVDGLLDGHITVINQAPIATNQSIETTLDTAFSGALIAADNDALTYSVVMAPTNGGLIINNAATGAFTYTPNIGFIGSDSFTFMVNDGTIDSNVATVNINVAAAPIIAPDLTVVDFHASNSPSLAGVAGYIKVDISIQNQGDDNASPFYSHYYLSTDTNAIASGHYVNQLYSPSGLLAGETFSGTLSMFIPAATPPGDYYFGVIVDKSDRVDESNESNNIEWFPITIVDNDVDINLMSTALSKTSLSSGDMINLSARLQNLGSNNMGADASTVSYHLSSDPIITPTDTLLGVQNTPTLNRWGMPSVNVSLYNAVINVAPGTYYIGAIADADNALVERDEGNNGNGSTGIAITVVSDPDLIISSFTGISETEAGRWAGTGVVVSNIGGSRSAAFDTRYYLSTDAHITTDDQYLNKYFRRISGMPGGTSYTSNENVFIPAGLAPGTYYIGVIADALNQAPESDEANNSASFPITVIQNGVDATVTSVIPSVTSLATGSWMAITAAINNLGNYSIPAGGLKVNFYLSDDANITTADSLLGSRNINTTLAGGGSVSVTYSPAYLNVTPGTYYIGAIADPDNTRAELNENNNWLVSDPIMVGPGPDLSATNLVPPPSPLTAGGMVVVPVTMENLGGGDAGSFSNIYYLSTDAVISSEDTYLNITSHTSGLAAGASLDANAYLLIPSGTAPGSYYIGVKVDRTNWVKETDENNNTFAVLVEVQ